MNPLLYFTMALSLASTTVALPQYSNDTSGAAPALSASKGSSAKAACTPNLYEMANLYHHHDINTGDVLFGEKIISLGAVGRQRGGTGCSPLWAAGGTYDDKALFPGGEYPKAVQELLANKRKPVSVL